ncbi:Protein of unknown function, partial [Gryllus bimaculatus]
MWIKCEVRIECGRNIHRAWNVHQAWVKVIWCVGGACIEWGRSVHRVWSVLGVCIECGWMAKGVCTEYVSSVLGGCTECGRSIHGMCVEGVRVYGVWAECASSVRAGCKECARRVPRVGSARADTRLAVAQEDDPEERVEAWEVQERRPGGGLLAEGGDAEAAQDPRRTSLVQYVRATLKNRGEMRLVLDIEAMTAKEIGMYQHVLPNMASLWPEQAFDVFPRCIHSSDDALILEVP